jgi:hypothetical protein
MQLMDGLFHIREGLSRAGSCKVVHISENILEGSSGFRYSCDTFLV